MCGRRMVILSCNGIPTDRTYISTASYADYGRCLPMNQQDLLAVRIAEYKA